MLAPLAPHVAEELWARLGHDHVAGLRAVPGGRPGAAGRGHGRAAGAGQRQGPRPRRRWRPTPTPSAIEAAALADEQVQAALDGASAEEGDRRARPDGQHRRVTPLLPGFQAAFGATPLLTSPPRGAVAQLVERFHGMEEVRGSIPLSSTRSAQVIATVPRLLRVTSIAVGSSWGSNERDRPHGDGRTGLCRPLTTAANALLRMWRRT